MTNNKKPQSKRNAFQQQINAPKTKKSHGDVWQDKGASALDRRASRHPAARQEVTQSHTVSSNASRSQNKSIPKRKTTHLTLWVKPVVKRELQRIAEQEGLSVSAAGGALLEKSLQQNIDLQYSALLTPSLRRQLPGRCAL